MITLTIKAVADREADHDLRQIEAKAAAIIHRALQALRRDLFRNIDDRNVQTLIGRIQHRETWQPFEDALYRALTPAIEKGTEIGRLQIERDVFGVVKRSGVGIDWDMANEAAASWLQSYIPDLIAGITRTSTTAVQREVTRYIRDSRTMGQLTRSLAATFGEARASRIAVTEVTRTYAEGNIASWRESGVTQGKRWNTNRDEIVCMICRPLNDTVVPIDQSFGGLIDNPPAHPNCRCWVSPVIDMERITGGSRDTTPTQPITVQPTANAPKGTPVSNALRLPKSGKYAKDYREAVAAIDQVHGDGNLPPIPVKTQSNMKALGQYRYVAQDPVFGSPFKSVDILIHGKGTSKQFTLAHEIGHFIDVDALGHGKPTAMKFEPFREAVENSAAYKRIKDMQANPDGYLRDVTSRLTGKTFQLPPDPLMLRYYLDDAEIWARAYSQYIAEKSGNTQMLDQLSKELEDELYGSRQWSKEDFEPISKAIDMLFKALEWIQ